MIGYRPLTLMKYCWKYVTPVVCIVSARFTLIQGGMVILGHKLQCYSSSSPLLIQVYLYSTFLFNVASLKIQFQC